MLEISGKSQPQQLVVDMYLHIKKDESIREVGSVQLKIIKEAGKTTKDERLKDLHMTHSL